ncbi:MAG: threonylcarbamoyl-AMP synthase [Methanophagales archaeon]|nr:threonylcarbamoyl-AMP synthase [Methanophagales archaeon]
MPVTALEAGIANAIEVIKSGGTVIYPTETVYGLGAAALSDEAVKKVYELKRRSLSMPISLAVSSFEMLHEVAYVEQSYMGIITRLLPGPVTILLRKKPVVPDVLTAHSEVVGIRFPENPIATRIISETGPITATSANLTGEKPPVCAEEVKIKADIIINGGKCKYGIPSTVVDMTRGMKILREGANYDRILHILQSEAAGEGLHGLSVP